MKILVIPSNREACLQEFLAAWEGKEGWDCLIVVEDNSTKTFKIPYQYGYHYAWDSIEEEVGKHSWIFSKRDSAIRCFGLWKAWQMGAEYVLTLDDDCFPEVYGKNIFDDHIESMQAHCRWTDSVFGQRTRGMPYKNLGTLPEAKANIGLWNKHPDWDAIQTLSHPYLFFAVPHSNRIIPHSQYFPVCGMNLCIKREAIPLFYFPLMGQDQPYSRFDDIWAGIIAKKVMDHLGWQMSVGEPFVEHRKASDPFVNLVKEAPGIGLNENLWEVIDKLDLTADEPIGCMKEIGIGLQLRQTDPYFHKIGMAICTWTKLFQSNS